MRRRRLLDLFCGGGGAARGYHDAGFDEIVGWDVAPMPRYPFEFHQGDAMELIERPDFLDGFDAVHASAPCHEHSDMNAVNGIEYGTAWMLPAVIKRFRELDKPWVVENVPGAAMHMPGALMLCGTEFNLSTTMPSGERVWLRRHRLFLSNVHLWGAGGCHCRGRKIIGVYGGGSGGPKAKTAKGPGVGQAAREVMGIDWMIRDELDEAIPPAYTEHIGRQLIEALELVA